MKKIKNSMWGIVFIVIGIIIALNTLKITKIDLFFDGFWTLFIIVPSIIGIFTEKDKKGKLRFPIVLHSCKGHWRLGVGRYSSGL